MISDKMDGAQLLQTLLNLSEQAANIACLIRDDMDLFKLLISSKEKRMNGEADFKTLADVLIQATFKYGIVKQFPDCIITIMGEEDNTFPSDNGPVNLNLTDNQQNTRDVLSRILRDRVVVNKLTRAVHNTVHVQDELVRQCRGVKLPDVLNIWIDPIDSTNSYINGEEDLESVTVLVGVHHAGLPILGVMTYPFTKKQLWGLCYQEHRVSNILPVPQSPIKTVLCSRMESTQLLEKLTSAGYKLLTPTGAGFKLGNVIQGHAAFYCISVSSTYQWDTCGPHAILRSLGGDVINIRHPFTTLQYNDKRVPNKGFIAYSSKTQLRKLLEIL